MLTFDPARHEYRWNGNPVPHVTGILKPLTDYSLIPPERLEVARQKGVAVHRMVELWAKDDLDEATLPEWLRPVLAWWREWVDQTGFELIASERRVYHPVYDYAGTFDLCCALPKTKLRGHGILDLKRSFFAGRAIALQTAAYAAAYDDQEYRGRKTTQWRAALRLREDAPPRLEIYADANDFNVFLAALTLYRWRNQ